MTCSKVSAACKGTLVTWLAFQLRLHTCNMTLGLRAVQRGLQEVPGSPALAGVQPQGLDQRATTTTHE